MGRRIYCRGNGVEMGETGVRRIGVNNRVEIGETGKGRTWQRTISGNRRKR